MVTNRKLPSIFTIGEVCKEKKQGSVSFLKVDKEKILKDILNLDVSEAPQDTDIPSKIIKENPEIVVSFLHSSFDTSGTISEFPSLLKEVNISPTFKEGERYSKDNYRPVCVYS